MTQPRTSGVPGYDVATVVIEGKADKVYGTALKTIKATQNLRITRQDPDQRIIDFSDGTRAAGLKVSQVNEKVVHLLIASVVMPRPRQHHFVRRFWCHAHLQGSGGKLYPRALVACELSACYEHALAPNL